MDPFTIFGMISSIVGLVGKGMQTASQIDQLNAAEKAAKRNQQMSMLAAQEVRFQGRQQSMRSLGAGTEQGAAATAMFAGMGVNANYGNAAEFARESRVNSQLDSEIIRNNAARKSWGLEQQAEQYGEQADQIQGQSKGVLLSGILGIGGSLLGMADKSGLINNMFGDSASGLSTSPTTSDWETKWGYSKDDMSMNNPEQWAAGYKSYTGDEWTPGSPWNG